jgi:arginase family enzyme
LSVTDPFDPNLSENRRWLSVADLVGAFDDAKIALIGAPLGSSSVTPGRCDLAPQIVRTALKRMSVYDVETGMELRAVRVADLGDLDLVKASPADSLEPLSAAVSCEVSRRTLCIILGGNNAITRPCVHGIDATLKNVGLLTLDAHFDLRDTDQGLNNGNPIQALLEDGLAGSSISQIGIAPFANTKRAHEKAKHAGISVRTMGECRTRGLLAVVREELQRLSERCDRIHVDFDIDAIDRAQMPAAPGARPGGIPVHEYLAAARLIASHAKVIAVDLAEFDPSLDVGDIGALTAARWFAEILAGVTMR